MEGEEERSDKEGSFSRASIGKRIAIVLAGGVVNIVFGLVVYFAILSISGNNISNVVESTIPDYGAQIAGIQSGDQILKMNDKKIRTKSDVNDTLDKSTGEELKIQVKRKGEVQEIEVKPTAVKTKSTGIYLSRIR